MKTITVTVLAVLISGTMLIGCAKPTQNQVSLDGFALNVENRTDAMIARMQDLVKKHPANVDGYNKLGSALVQKGRETGELDWYDRAKTAFEEANEIDSDDPITLRNLGWISTVYHRFFDAIDYSKKAISANPNDNIAYGVLTDSYFELGRYDEAIQSAQKMMDLHPDLASYSRAAQLRFVRGDTKGAITLMLRAVEAGGPYPENTAWAKVQLTDLYFKTGAVRAAEVGYTDILKTNPDYRHAVAGLARVRAAQGKYADAAELMRKATTGLSPIPYVIELGDYYSKLGDSGRAAEAYARVDAIIAEHLEHGVEGDELVQAMFYLDKDKDIKKALELAEMEVKEHTTVSAYTTLAWAYYKNDEIADAEKSIRKALAMNTKDALLYYRAAKIFSASGKRSEARRWAYSALNLNPSFHVLYADDARKIALGQS